MSAKGRKRAPLPSRPEPPTVEEVVEDVHGAGPSDPVFSFSEESEGGGAGVQDMGGRPEHDTTDTQVHDCFQRCRRFVETHQQLRAARSLLDEKLQQLQSSEEELQATVAELQAKANEGAGLVA
ncbi:UPF0449 protein C19orf25 homolog [Lampetra fluviatilis]